ncbi:MAG: ABC transporter ATP-binding protein, partial [Candidatus Atribacteria bacterium]|nr:ABC transporter ATP-binding protein [Candidatus Atribacteria bacterium]
MKKSKSGHLLLKTCRFLKPYWKKGVVALFLMLIATLLQLPLPFLTKYIIDKVVVSKDMNLLNLIGFSLIGIIIFQSLTGFLKGVLLTVFSSRVLFDIRVKLFEHLQDLSLKFFRKNQTGYLMSRISSDVQSLHGLLADTFLSIVQNLLTFVVGIFAVFYIHKKLALISLLILPVYALVTWFFNKKIRSMSWELREKYAEVQRDLQELITGMFTIQSFGAEKTSLLRMFKSTKGETKQSIKLSIFGSLYVFLTSIISSSAPLIILWYGCYEIMRGNLTLGG